MRFNSRGDLTGIPGGMARPWVWPFTSGTPRFLFDVGQADRRREGGYGQWLNDDTLALLEHTPTPGVLLVQGADVQRVAEGAFNTLFAGGGNWLATAITDRVRTIGELDGQAVTLDLRILDMDPQGRFLALTPGGGDRTFLFNARGDHVAGLPEDSIFCRMSDGLVMLRRHHSRRVEVYRADNGERVETVALLKSEQWPGAAWHVGGRLWLWYEIPGDRSVIHAADDNTRGYLLEGVQYGRAVHALSAMGALVAWASGEGEGIGWLHRVFAHDIAAGATLFNFGPPPPPPPPPPDDEEPPMSLAEFYTNRVDVAVDVDRRWPQLLKRARDAGDESLRGAFVDQLAHVLNDIDNARAAADPARFPGYIVDPWGRKYRRDGDPASANDDGLIFRLESPGTRRKKIVDVVLGDDFEAGWDLRPPVEDDGLREEDNGFYGPPLNEPLEDGDTGDDDEEPDDPPGDLAAAVKDVREAVERVAAHDTQQAAVSAERFAQVNARLDALAQKLEAIEAKLPTAGGPGGAIVFPVYSGPVTVLGFKSTITLKPQPPQQ